MFLYDIREEYIIVIDCQSGMWVKWIPGQFMDSMKWGRYTFIDYPFCRNPEVKKRLMQTMVKWIKSNLPYEVICQD